MGIRHLETECGSTHCKCMGGECANFHFADHVQDCGHTAIGHIQGESKGTCFKEAIKPNKTIAKVKSIHIMEGDVHNADLGYGFSGLILELESGRILTHGSTDPMEAFSELKPDSKNYEQIKALIS